LIKKEKEIKDEIIDTLIQCDILRYSELRKKIKTAKSDRTFRKYLFELVDGDIVKRIPSSKNKQLVRYSIYGHDFESASVGLEKKNINLQQMQIEIQKQIRSHLMFLESESNPQKILQSQFKLTYALVDLLGFIFEIHRSLFYLMLIRNIPLIRKTESCYDDHIKQFSAKIKLLEKHDRNVVIYVMGKFIQKNKSLIRVPGFIPELD